MPNDWTKSLHGNLDVEALLANTYERKGAVTIEWPVSWWIDVLRDLLCRDGRQVQR